MGKKAQGHKVGAGRDLPIESLSPCEIKAPLRKEG